MSLFRQRFLESFGNKSVHNCTDDSGDDHTAEDVDEVVDADEDAGETDEESEGPQNKRELFIEGKDDRGDSGGDESMVGWEAVVGGVRDERHEVSDDKRSRIVIEHTADFCGDVDCG